MPGRKHPSHRHAIHPPQPQDRSPCSEHAHAPRAPAQPADHSAAAGAPDEDPGGALHPVRAAGARAAGLEEAVGPRGASAHQQRLCPLHVNRPPRRAQQAAFPPYPAGMRRVSRSA
eukprot:305387-Rhodomonas_salina.1